MGKVMSMRLTDGQTERLGQVARRWGRKPSQAAATLLEEALQMDAFPLIEFRDTIVGRQAYLKGSRVKAWQVEWIARNYDHDLTKTAEHFGMPEHYIEAGLAFARAHAVEMEEAIADNSKTFEELKQILPNIERAW